MAATARTGGARSLTSNAFRWREMQTALRRLGGGIRLGAALAGAGAGDQPPEAVEDEEDGEGHREADRPQDQQEDDEGDYRQRDEEKFHAP